MIVKRHIAEGYEMAKRERLPQAVRDAIPEHPEPVCAHLRQDVSLLGHGLGHNHVEGADPVAGDQQHRLVVGGIHLTDLALADQR